MNPLDSLQPWMIWTFGISIVVLFFCIAYLVNHFQRPKAPNLDSVHMGNGQYWQSDTIVELALASHAVSIPDSAVVGERARALLVVANYKLDGGHWRKP